MPQLSPTFLIITFLFSWTVFMILLLPKTSSSAHPTEPNSPTVELLSPTVSFWQWL